MFDVGSVAALPLEDLERQVRERTAESLISLNLAEENQRQLEAMESDLLASRERYRALFHASKDAVYITAADGTILDMNPAALDLFGLTPEDLASFNARDLYVDPEDRQKVLKKFDSNGAVKDCEVVLRGRDGRPISCLLTGSVRIGPDGTRNGYQGIIRDITDQKRLLEELRRGAFEDALTGLANRALFLDRLGHAISIGRRGPGRFAVYVLDLDSFKVINNSLGSSLGDSLLVQASRRLRDILGPSDTLARLGSDEFALLVEGLADPGDAKQVAESLLGAMKPPFELGGKSLYCSASIGIVFAQGSHARPEDLLRDADTAMHQAKALGRATYALFTEAMHADTLARLELETELRQAIHRGDFCLHYQPILNLGTGLAAGFEALVRWLHPEEGLRMPGEFIRLAEETGLIEPLGRWILDEACRTLARWRKRPEGKEMFMSVNLSARQFARAGLADDVKECLGRHRLPARALMLEVTESMIMEQGPKAQRTLEELKALGVRLLIDDFGTGYSSLEALHRLPIDILKIDRGFVGRMDEDREAREIVGTIIKLAHTMGLEVIAEGIETPKQNSALKRRRCEYGQGYRFARPLPASKALGFLSSGHGKFPHAARIPARSCKDLMKNKSGG